jgi:replicative DNA helicase
MRQGHAKGARLFIIDYLQLLEPGFKTSNSNEKMAAISKAIKNAAKELNCPVITIASLNRDSAKQNREPQRSDLRDSGQIEYDADKIILLHAIDDHPSARTVQADVAKNKDGHTGKCAVTFYLDSMEFTEQSMSESKPNPHDD